MVDLRTITSTHAQQKSQLNSEKNIGRERVTPERIGAKRGAFQALLILQKYATQTLIIADSRHSHCCIVVDRVQTIEHSVEDHHDRILQRFESHHSPSVGYHIEQESG